jgi:hypothetical protein
MLDGDSILFYLQCVASAIILIYMLYEKFYYKTVAASALISRKAEFKKRY